MEAYACNVCSVGRAGNTGVAKHGDPVFPQVWGFFGTTVLAVPIQCRMWCVWRCAGHYLPCVLVRAMWTIHTARGGGGGASPRFCTRLPPHSRNGPKAPRGGGGGFREGRWGGEAVGRVGWGGGVQVGRLGGGGRVPEPRRRPTRDTQFPREAPVCGHINTLCHTIRTLFGDPVRAPPLSWSGRLKGPRGTLWPCPIPHPSDAPGQAFPDADDAGHASCTLIYRDSVRPLNKPQRHTVHSNSGGGGIAVREWQIQWQNIAGNRRKMWGNAEQLREIAETLRCRNQTPRSLKEQHLCTWGHTGHQHAREGDRQNTEKRGGGENCGPQPPLPEEGPLSLPPPM